VFELKVVVKPVYATPSMEIEVAAVAEPPSKVN